MSIRPRKRFAQHWLRSEKALNKIVSAAQLQPHDRILEIGPGTGILTRRLLSEVATVVAVEIDRDLCAKLTKNLGARENFLLLQGDILSMNLEAQIQPFPLFCNPNKVVANIPYNITGPIIEKLLGTIATPATQTYESIVLLVQREVAHRLCSKPGSKNFGALSVRVQYLAESEFICDVPAKAFYPPPKVDSAVVRLSPQPPEIAASNPKYLSTLVKLGFANKRKMLRNNLTSIIDAANLTTVLEKLEINSQSRAEDLSVADWVRLSDALELLQDSSNK